MPGRIPPTFIDELLARTDIVEVIGSRIELRRSGQNHKGLCPFHGEKTPSFNVNANKQFYYCFGCQASGHALKFLMEYEHLEFPAAVETLAGMVGLEVPREAQDARTEERQRRRKPILEMLAQADEYFRAQIRHHPERERAVDYLRGRGVRGETARDFGIGFAPPGGRNLQVALQKSNEDRDLLIAAGLVRPDGDRVYELFRDRLIFPVRNLRGQVIAFGGRIFGDGQPKYLNSPETDVFRKGSELYGLFEARQTRQLDSLLVVEGYMDVVALAQAGITNAVATLGTATTADHIHRLFNQVQDLTFCFDGDTAGNNAAWKALELALPAMEDGRSVRFLQLPNGEDPDSVVRAEGSDAFRARLRDARPLAELLFSHLSASVDTRDPAGRAALARSAGALLRKLPAGVFKQLMWQRLAESTGLSAAELASLVKGEPERQKPAAGAQGLARRSRQHPTVDKITGSLISYPELATQVSDDMLRRFSQSAATMLVVQLVQIIRSDEELSRELLLREISDDVDRGWLGDKLREERLLPLEEKRLEFGASLEYLVSEMERFENQQVKRVSTDIPLSEMSEEHKAFVRRTHRRSGNDDVPF